MVRMPCQWHAQERRQVTFSLPRRHGDCSLDGGTHEPLVHAAEKTAVKSDKAFGREACPQFLLAAARLSVLRRHGLPSAWPGSSCASRRCRSASPWSIRYRCRLLRCSSTRSARASRCACTLSALGKKLLAVHEHPSEKCWSSTASSTSSARSRAGRPNLQPKTFTSAILSRAHFACSFSLGMTTAWLARRIEA